MATHVDGALSPVNEKRGTVSASPEPVVAEPSDGIHTVGGAQQARSQTMVPPTRIQTHSSDTSSRPPIENTKRPPPFSRKVTKSLFIKPPSQRGTPPSYAESIKNLATYSCLNVLLICNPISWALHYTHQTAGATFALALLGVIPLAGLLGYGTEAIALYTGDALGGLINASFGNATEFIIAILLLVKCEIRVVQASLLGGLLSNLLLVLGMAFLVGGFRFSEQEFRQTAAQLNTSLMTLAVISLIIPSAFAFALRAAVGEDKERDIILEMSRGSSIILIFIYISYMVFQLYSHAHYYNPDADLVSQAPSRSSSRTSSRIHGAAPAAPASGNLGVPTGPLGVSTLTSSPAILPQSPPLGNGAPEWGGATGGRADHTRLAPRRATSLPFGSAAQLGGAQRPGVKKNSLQYARERGASPYVGGTPVVPSLAGAAASTAHNVLGDEKALRRRDHSEPDRPSGNPADVEAAAVHAEDSDDKSDEGPENPELNLPVAFCTLAAATGLTYLTAEALTDSLESIGDSSGVSKEWLGLILLAVVGNAAEHVTAVFVAYRNKVDLALAVSVGSCIQIALFVIPALVLIGWAADKPLSLLFDPLETVVLFLSVLLVRFATEDGRTHYMSGVALLGTYILIAFAFWYYPEQGTDVGNLFDSC